jgi:hypothetical protein
MNRSISLKYFLLIPALLFFINNKALSSDFTGSKTVVEYVQPNQGNPFYAYSTTSYDIGKDYNGTTQETETARTKFTFDLTSIPVNATINSVYLNYTIFNYENGSYHFKTTQIGNYNSPPEIYQNIGSASILFTDVFYNSGTLNNGTLTSMVNNSKGSYLYIGAFSQNESSLDSWANLNLTLSVDYSTNVDITAQNNFIYGIIKVGVDQPAAQRNSPFPFSANVGQTVNFEAQNQTHGGYERVWNNYAPNVPSKWRKNGTIDVSSTINYSFQAAQNDDNATYEAGLRKNYTISKDDQTEFDGTISSGVVTHIVEQNSGQISATLQQTLNGKTYKFAGWTDDYNASTTRTITPTDNKTYTALYKYPFHSNNQTAYSTNSQRKFVRTPDGSFHSVYESMGYVWYEKSTNGGSTWQLMNSGKPVGNREAKSPSICFLENTVFITYQYDPFVGITWFNSGGQSFIAADSIMNPLEEVMNYETNASPVIEAKADRLLLVYKNDGLKYQFFQWYSSGNGDLYQLSHDDILNTDNASVNPTLAVDKSTSNYNFHLAWGQGDNIIRYQKITSSDGIRLEQSSSCYKANLAANDGYTKNYTPTLVVLGDDLARASWIGERNTITDEESINEKRVVFRGVKCDNTSFSFWNFGYDVRSATIQKSNDNANYFIIWNEENNATKATNNTTLSVIKNLSTAGHNVQVCNGATKYDMYGMVFNSTSLPYTFNKTNNIQSYFENPSKEQYGNAVYAGREGTVNKDGANIYYTVGDVLVDGSIINFKEITETTEINSNQDVKRYLETEPFELNDNSSFLYSVQYGLTENPGGIFNSAEFINFKVKLVDAETNAVISVFDDVNYNANNLLPYNSIQYSVNTNGIGNRTVKLMLDMEDNFDAVYSVTSKFSDAEILPKAVRKEVGLGENFNVTEYDLSQNYPNPFNPSTTIRYQIPEDGIVTLKIYDILGREVITVVNEVKSKGRYEVVFDASQLASGLYIYEITSGSYKASKKMTLIK